MKNPKAFLLAITILFIQATTAQNPSQKPSANMVVIDTLHYYFNKFYFKSGTPQLNTFPYYSAAAATNTQVTYVGSKFENTEPLEIKGVEGYVAKFGFGVSPVKFYICDLDPVTGLPMLPGRDSVEASVFPNQSYIPMLVGGNFTAAITVTTNFAVLFRNLSPVSGDSVLFLRTAGKTATNNVATASEKYSDGNGFVRYNVNFFSATNFTAQGFGIGTDYEFLLAPRVQYTVQASHLIPQDILDANAGDKDTLCTRTKFTFTNTSSYRYMHRMYNLNEFSRAWNISGITTDAPITWFFEYDDNRVPPRDPRVFLPSGSTSTISSSSDLAGCFNYNAFRACLKLMGPYGRGASNNYSEEFDICMKFCNDGVGLNKYGLDTQVSLSPNPAMNGYTRLSGLSGHSHLRIFDSSGRLITTMSTFSGSFDIDLRGQTPGIYQVEIRNDSTVIKTQKLIYLTN